MKEPVFCINEDKNADQLRGNCTADKTRRDDNTRQEKTEKIFKVREQYNQRLCFRYMDSTIPLLP